MRFERILIMNRKISFFLYAVTVSLALGPSAFARGRASDVLCGRMEYQRAVSIKNGYVKAKDSDEHELALQIVEQCKDEAAAESELEKILERQKKNKEKAYKDQVKPHDKAANKEYKNRNAKLKNSSTLSGSSEPPV